MKSIETKALSIAYDERYIVEDLNLSLSKGKITSIIGANGCGKSTIIKTIGRVLRQKAGVVTIDGSGSLQASF